MSNVPPIFFLFKLFIELCCVNGWVHAWHILCDVYSGYVLTLNFLLFILFDVSMFFLGDGTNRTCMVENFWTMMIVYSHGKRLNFAQSKKTAMFLRMCYLKRKFGFWWIDSLLREDAGLEASPPTTKAYADAQSKLREQNRVRKATAEYKKQDQNATQMRRAVASSRRISHRAKTYAGMGRCERERGERQVKAIKRGRAGKKCPDCGGNHGRNSPLCMLTSKEAAMFTHAKPKALDLGLVLKRGRKKRRRK